MLRLEDPTLLTGAGKYVDDLVEPGMLHVAFVRSTVAHGALNGVDVGGRRGDAGRRAVYHAGNDLGLPSLQGFAMMPPALNRPIFAPTGCASSATSAPPSSPRRRRRRSTPPRPCFVDFDPLPAVMTAADGLAAGCAAAVPRARLERLLRHEFHGDDGDPLEGADVVAEVTMVSQRLAGVPMETNGILAVPDDDGR